MVCWWGERKFSPTAVQGANGAEQHCQAFDSSDLCACAGNSIITMYEGNGADILAAGGDYSIFSALFRNPGNEVSGFDTCLCLLAGDSIITIYERAMAQVWLRLEAIAQQHGVADALQALLRVSACTRPVVPSLLDEETAPFVCW